MNATIKVGNPLRGPGTQNPRTLFAQELNITLAWGAQPATAVITYVAEDVLLQNIIVGSALEIVVPGHVFHGICLSDNVKFGASGHERIMEFADHRQLLQYDYVMCCFNQPDVSVVAGKRLKRWWHILPEDFVSGQKTFTIRPLTAAEILEYLFDSIGLRNPQVKTAWRRFYHPDMLSFPVYDLNFQPSRFDAALAQITDRMGLVFTLSDYLTLTWRRPGYLMPGERFLPVDERGQLIFPKNALGAPVTDERRDGISLNLNDAPDRIIILGDRNLYQIYNLPLAPDWLPAFVAFYDINVVFTTYIFDHLVTPAPFGDIPAGTPYNAIPGDVEGITGRSLAQARALEITVRDFADAIDANGGDGSVYRDPRKFAGRWRMDMPVALYIQALVFRAFRVPATLTINGYQLDNRSVVLQDQVLAQVTHDPATGVMTADIGKLIDGNGCAIAQGYNLGTDMFKLLTPERFDLASWVAGQSSWQQVPFQIDDSGEGTRFIIFDAPIVNSIDLITMIDGYGVLKAPAHLGIPAVRASLTFEAERFAYDQPKLRQFSYKPRDVVETVNGLHGEFLLDAGAATPQAQEIPYADGRTAVQKANLLLSFLLKMQPLLRQGGYKRYLQPGDAGLALNGMFSRISVHVSTSEISETVDFTSERRRNSFEPEADYNRRIVQRAVFPGQQELRHTAAQEKLVALAFRQNPNFARFAATYLHGQLGSTESLSPVIISGADGTTPVLPAGTPLWKAPTTPDGGGGPSTNTVAQLPAAVTDAHKEFAGATVRDQEQPHNTLFVQSSGSTLIRVQGPVAFGDTVVKKNGADYLVTQDAGDVDSPVVGLARQVIADGSTKLIPVDVGAGAGSGDGVARWA